MPDDDVIDRLAGPYAWALRELKDEDFDGTQRLAEVEAVAAIWPE
ncbi:MAG: hypothetical protein ACRDK2_16575 [Solirubrobacteraceae bacterium]